MTNTNVHTTSKIRKQEAQAQPFELGTFISHESNQTDQMRKVATLNDKSINGNVDPVMIEIQKLNQALLSINEKVTLIENDGIKGRDFDAQVLQALKDLKSYASFYEQAIFQMENKLLKTSVSIAQKIIGIEVGENSAAIAKETINSMMDKITAASTVKIHLNPKDYIVLKEQLNFEAFVELHEDPNVAIGGVVIASDLGNFDGNVEAKISNMLESLDLLL
jgi:flagellar assembly protein FliH